MFQQILYTSTDHPLILFLRVTYSVFLVNNIYLFHLCSVNPLYVILQNILCILSSANGGIKLLHTYIPPLHFAL